MTATPGQAAPVSPDLECTACAPGVTPPHGVPATPGQATSLDAAIQAAAEVLFRDYESQYSAGHLTWTDFAGLARKTVEAAISASAKIVAEHGWTPPQPAPELAAAMAETRQLRAALRTLADLWDASSSRDEESALRPNRAALVLEERATTRRQCAADIRKLAGLPS